MREPSLSVIKMIRVSWFYHETYKEKELLCTQQDSLQEVQKGKPNT